LADDLEQLLNDGIAAAKAGNKVEARRLIEEVLAKNDRLERAWLALASLVDTPRERRICLENVLEINPNNERARQAINQLDATVPSAPATRSVAAPPPPTPSNPPPSRPAASESSPRRTQGPVTAPKGRPGTQATVGAREAWRSQRNQQGFRMSIPFITVAILGVLVIGFGIALLVSTNANGTPTPGVSNTPLPTLSVAELNLTQFPLGTPSPTPAGTLITDITLEPANLAPSWTPSPTRAPSKTSTPKPTLPPLTQYEMLFVGERNGSTDQKIFVTKADGSGEKQIAVGINPVWSPNGSKIAYVGVNADTNKPELVVINADGSDPTVVATTEGDSLVTPAWSANGDKLAFAANEPDAGNLEIYTVDADGSNRLRVTNHLGDDLGPVWSPVSEAIIYSSDPTGRGSYQLILRDMVSGRDTQLTQSSGQNLDAMWSPDGSYVVFASTRDRFSQIYRMNADGSDERPLTFGADSGENRYPAWSSDGNYLVFASNRNGGVFNLFIMTPDGKNVKQITNAVGVSSEGKFRPNGF
jgi:Tol biopolymer transport system component